VVRNIAEKLSGQAAVVQINTQENPVLATRFGIRGIPVIVLLNHGKVVSQLTGVQSIESVTTYKQRTLKTF
jgi:thioredoxin 2